MTFSEEFNTAQEKAGDRKQTFYLHNAGTSLSFLQDGRGANQYFNFHFLTRTMTVTTGHSEGGVTVTPFSQIDREVLEFMHAKLVELGGHPPSLPKDDSLPSPIRKNNP